MSSPFVRRACSLLALTFAALSGACGESSDPLALQSEPVVLMGRVSSLSSPAAGPAMASGSSSLSGIEVSVEGAAATTVTDDSGNFRLEVEADDDTIVLRFRRGALDVRLELAGVVSGTIRLEVRLSDDGGEVIHRDDDHDDEDFDGRAAFVSLTGDAPARTLRVELTRALGPSVMVDVVEGSTVFDAEGDVLTFAALLAALDRTDVAVRIEGDGDVQSGGVRVATFVKVETDEHQDGPADDDGGDDNGGGDDDGVRIDFEGTAELLSVSGTAPARTALVELVMGGDSVEVLIAEDGTAFDGEGDVGTFAGLLEALDRTDVTVRIEGDGEIQDGGARVATFVKVETDEHEDGPGGDDDPNGSGALVEFKGTAEFVSVSGLVPSRSVRVRVRGEVSGEARVWLVDLVEGETSFDASGDFQSVGSVLTALASAGTIGRLEGYGTLQGDVVVAATARAEVD
jgi:hypothetical protein